MRILVTGGAGFLGSHLSERLASEGHAVTILDDLSSGSRTNLTPILNTARAQLVVGDVAEAFEGNFEQIYNLACPASPPRYQKDPIKTFRTSVWGVSNLLGLATRSGARFLQASTSEIYGDALRHPQDESYWGNVNPIGPRACYDEGKRAAETLCFDYARQRGTAVKVARIFNTYGPRMQADDGRVVSNLIVQALQGKPLTIYGTGQQTRSFCYVDDLIDGLIRLMNSPATVTGPINLGNPGEFTMLQLAEEIRRITGGTSAISFMPLPEDDPRMRRPDIGRAKAELGWEPAIQLSEGLERTIGYFADVLRRGLVPA